MQFSLGILVGVIVLSVSIGGALVYFLLRAHINKVGTERDKAKAVFLEKEKYLSAEIKRQSFVLEDYKKRLFHKKGKTSLEVDANQAAISNANKELELKELVLEAKKVEEEKKRFQEKNQKLWEQSIAIHKEKERIDGLKREIERKHRELTDSIRYAKRIQDALLPDDEYVDLLLKEYFILWKPRDIVSGDFYWIKRIRNYTIIVAADCTGHGVPGAFMSMLGIAFLNEVANKIESVKANEILDQLRDLVKLSLKQSVDKRTPADGMDMAMCIIDHGRNLLQYSGANNPLLFIRDGNLEQLKPTRNPIAIYRKEKPFELHTMELRPGDQFCIFSDGFVDQFGGEIGMRMTIRRFKQAFMQYCNLPHAQQKEKLEQFLKEWQGDYNQLDDILVIGFKV